MFQSPFHSQLPPFCETSEAPFSFSPHSRGRSLHFVTLCKPRVFGVRSDWLSGLCFSSCHLLRSLWDRLAAPFGAGGAQISDKTRVPIDVYGARVPRCCSGTLTVDSERKPGLPQGRCSRFGLAAVALPPGNAEHSAPAGGALGRESRGEEEEESRSCPAVGREEGKVRDTALLRPSGAGGGPGGVSEGGARGLARGGAG